MRGGRSCCAPGPLVPCTLKDLAALQVVAPKRAALSEANKRLEGANKKLTGIRAKVKELKDRVALLEESLMKVRGLLATSAW